MISTNNNNNNNNNNDDDDNIVNNSNNNISAISNISGNSDSSSATTRDRVKLLQKEECNMSPISLGSPPSTYATPIGMGSPMSLRYHKSPSAFEIGDIKEKIQHLGWISTPNSLNPIRQRSSSMAVGSPGSMAFINSQLEELTRQLEDKEKDAHLAAEIGRVLLEKNQELEDKLSYYSELELKYIDDSTNLSFLKNQNELLNGTLKEAEIENEILFEKLKIEDLNSKQFLSAHRLNSGKKTGKENDIDKLNLEIEELKIKESQREKSFIKVRNEKEILNQRIHLLESEISSSHDSLKEIDELKERNRKLSLKNKTLKSFSEINVRKSIVEEFNLLKDICHITLDKMISNTNSMIKEFSAENEIKFFEETKKLLDSFEINKEMNEPIIVQLIQKLKELDKTNNNNNLQVTSKNISKSSDNLIKDGQQAEASSNNLIRSSLLLVISMYMMNKQKEFDEQILQEKSKIKELIEDFNELNEKLLSTSKLNSKLELINLSSINEIESFKNQLKDVNDTLETLKEQHLKDILELQQQAENGTIKSLQLKDSEISQLKDQLQKLEFQVQEIELLRESELKLKSEIQDIKSRDCFECLKLKDYNTSLLKDNEELALLKSKQCEKCLDFEKALIESNQVIEEHKNQNLQQSNQLLQLQSNLQDEIEQLKSKECEICISSSIDFNKRIQSLEEKIQEQINNESLIKENYDNKIKELQEKSLQEIDEYKSRLLTLEKQLLEQININNNYDSQIKSLKSEVKKECQQCKEYEARLNEKCKSCIESKHHISELESQLLQECKSCIESKHQISNLESQLSQPCQSCLELKQYSSQLEDKISQECKSCIESKKQISNLESQLNQDCKSCLELKNRVDSLEKDLSKECSSCKELKIKLSKDCQPCIGLQENIIELEQNIIQLKGKLSQPCQKCVESKEKILQLETQLQQECKSCLILEENLMDNCEKLKKLSSDIQVHKQNEHFKLSNLKTELQQIQVEKELLQERLLTPRHHCSSYQIPDNELALLIFTENLLRNDSEVSINLECRECSMKSFIDGKIFSKLINHYFPDDSIDTRALHKSCTTKQEYQDNISLVINSMKVIDTSFSCSFSVSDIVDTKGTEIFKFLFYIIYNGLLSQFSLQKHPELSYFWKNNPEILENTTSEKWENFMVLEPPYLLARWVNHYLKKSGKPLTQNFTKDFKDFTVLHTLLTSLYDYNEPQVNGDTIIKYCKESLNISQLVTKEDIEYGNEQKIQFLLSQLFIVKNGLDQLTNSHATPSLNNNPGATHVSPRTHLQRIGSANNLLKLSGEDQTMTKEIIAPSSEEKAIKVWLKSIDLNISNLDDFRDGILLLKALDKISTGIVNWKTVTMNPNNTFQMTENCNYSVKIGKQMKFSLVGIAGKDFVDCNKKFLLSFVWQMMRLYVLQRISFNKSENTSIGSSNQKEFTESDLIKKLNQILSSQNKSTLFKSFNESSLSNGICLLDLLDSLKPGCIDYKEVKYDDSKESKKSNIKYFISVSRRLGCSAIIFIEDILDVKSNMILNFVCDLMMGQ